MKINSIQPNYYNNFKSRKSQKTTSVTNLNFKGYRENFARAIEEASIVDLKSFVTPTCKKNTYGMLNKLMKAINEYPESCKKKYHEIVSRCVMLTDTVDNTFKYIGERFAGMDLINDAREAAKRGQGITIVEDNGKPLLACYNFGKYDRGLFFKTQHEQVVLEFKDPNTGKFVGFSIAKDGGVAITRNSGRDEIYPEPFYHYRAHSKEGYDATMYDEEYPKGYFPKHLRQIMEFMAKDL